MTTEEKAKAYAEKAIRSTMTSKVISTLSADWAA